MESIMTTRLASSVWRFGSAGRGLPEWWEMVDTLWGFFQPRCILLSFVSKHAFACGGCLRLLLHSFRFLLCLFAGNGPDSWATRRRKWITCTCGWRCRRVVRVVLSSSPFGEWESEGNIAVCWEMTFCLNIACVFVAQLGFRSMLVRSTVWDQQGMSQIVRRTNHVFEQLKNQYHPFHRCLNCDFWYLLRPY